MRSVYVREHAPLPPRLRLMTCAGVGFGGAPDTRSPAAQATASAMSLILPPHLPSARTGRIFAAQSMPAVYELLSAFAAITPATDVPCQLLLRTSQSVWPSMISPLLTQSPGSLGSAS